MSCEQGHLDGAYVLGALSPEKRLQFERHLPTCPTCSRSVRELAGLPGLLAQVPVDVVESGQEAAPLPDTLLPALVREVRRGERRRRRVTWLAAAAAAVVVGGGTAAVVLHDGEGGTHGPAAVATAPARTMTPAGHSALAARLSMTPVLWGTRLDLTCSYGTRAAAGGGPYAHEPTWGSTTYALVVETAAGTEQQVATWRAVPGRTLHVSGATSWMPRDIAEVEVRAADGTPVLTLQG